MQLLNKNHIDRHVLVTDFDGTMTQRDFFKLAIESLLPADVPDYWAQYRAGVITHFEALRSYFAAIRASEVEVLAVVQRMELDANLPAAIESLRAAGWRVVVASAGCDWYIRRLLAPEGIDVEIFANPGRFQSGQGLLMEAPIGAPYFSPTLGVDKAGIVRGYLNAGYQVAFAGDGFPDVEPARLVPDDNRFARGDLAAVLRAERLAFQPYDHWSEIAGYLLQAGA
jgi:2-hydroxy-3-keto-5-methylthiopentenyl-1-phosphate phosphatase